MKKNLLMFVVLCLFLPAHPTDAKLAKASVGFPTQLFAQVSKPKENLIFSPYSITSALAMVAAGATANTLAEMKKTLGLSDHFQMDFRKKFGSENASKEFQLKIANRLWGKKAGEIKKEYLNDLNLNFHADLVSLAFETKPEPSRLEINKWVESVTEEKIKDLLPAGSITQSTDLVITNAIYFKGSWVQPFLKEETKKDDFFMAKTEKAVVDFMTHEGRYKYFKDSAAQILEIPYKGSELSFFVVLPGEKVKIDRWFSTISENQLHKWSQSVAFRGVNLSMPKFKIETSLDLVPVLKKLGMKAAFDPNLANFHKIRSPEGGGNLYVSGVVHKAFIEVNEEGTEAAAATGVIMFGTAASMDPPIPFKVNRPFIYFIRHATTGALLFLGKVSNPVL